MEKFSFSSRGERKPLPDLTPEEQKKSKELFDDYKEKLARGEVKPPSREKKAGMYSLANKDFADGSDDNSEE